MAEKEVKVGYKVEGIKEYNKDLKNLDKNLKETTDSTEDLGKETTKTGGKMGTLTKGLNKIGSVGKAAFKGIGTAIKATGVGLLVTLIAKLVEQFTKTDTGAKILQGSLAVLGVIFERIEKVVNFLFDYLVQVFENPQKAVDDFKLGVEALSGWFSSLGDYIKNNFLLLVQNLQKELLEIRIAWNEWTGDSEEADQLKTQLQDLENQMKDTKTEIENASNEIAEPFIAAGQAIKEVVDELVKDTSAAIDASNKAIDTASRFADLQNRLIVENAQLTKDLETQKKIAEDTTRSYDERKEALDKVNEANEKLADNALLEAQANEDLLKQQLDLATNDEDRRTLQAELAAATAERIAKEQEAEIVRLESAKLSRELDLEEKDRIQSINDLTTQLLLETTENEREAARKSLEIAEEQTLKELESLHATEEEKEAVREYYRKLRAKQDDEFRKEDEEKDKESAEKKKDLEEQVTAAKFDIAKNALNAISQLQKAFGSEDEKDAKKNFNIQKALSLATATITGTEAVLNAYTSAKDPKNPLSAVPGYAAVQAGLAAAFAIAQIQTIRKTKYQSPGGINDTPPSEGGGGGINYNSLLQSQNQQLAGLQNAGGTITAGQTSTGSEPIRAYVLVNDVNTAQQANNQIENLSRL